MAISLAGIDPPLEPIKGLHICALSDPRLSDRIRVIDNYCLAAKYNDSYYDQYVRNAMHGFNHVAFFHDILVGSITCRIEPTETENEYRLYIMTIAVLEPYRKMGIGSRLLQTVLDSVFHEQNIPIVEVTLHMQVGSPAQVFYEKFMFEVVSVVKDYYPELEVHDALLMRRVIPQLFFDKKSHK